MAHLWIRCEDGWCARKLSVRNFEITPVLCANPPGDPPNGRRTVPARLVCTGLGATLSWAIVVSPASRAWVNGYAVPAGMRVLDDRDEIRVGGAQYFFSAESLVAIEAFPHHDRPVFCGRCRQPMQEGSLAVRCPGLTCQLYYHQDESAGFPCWTYSETCNFCATPTALDAGFVWAPEE